MESKKKCSIYIFPLLLLILLLFSLIVLLVFASKFYKSSLVYEEIDCDSYKLNSLNVNNFLNNSSYPDKLYKA